MKKIYTYHDDMLNGVGLREVLFLSGCEHHCKGCFNQITWNPDAPEATLFTEEDYQALLSRLNQKHINGLTLTGGDPLAIWNVTDVLNLVKRLEIDMNPDKTVWLYSGYTFENIYNNSSVDELSTLRLEILRHIDILCDGKFIEEVKSPQKPWVGSENQRVIKLKETLDNFDKKINKIVLL